MAVAGSAEVIDVDAGPGDLALVDLDPLQVRGGVATIPRRCRQRSRASEHRVDAPNIHCPPGRRPEP
ncbi:hypothetical protein MCHIJ_29770 [Mycolicibacterium chitae]|nr:hypothetical protein MCHIJ_29770 [Mycolicibacterium chitae]